MAQENIELVYGGSDSGIMGIFSQTVLENNGKVTGIYPTGLFELETPKEEVTTFIPTDSIDERKVLRIANIARDICQRRLYGCKMVKSDLFFK